MNNMDHQESHNEPKQDPGQPSGEEKSPQESEQPQSEDKTQAEEHLAIREELAERWTDSLLFLSEEIHDNAILGVLERCNSHPVVIYNKEKALKNLQELGIESQEEAIEWGEFHLLLAPPNPPGGLGLTQQMQVSGDISLSYIY
jgi:hypothetical protein